MERLHLEKQILEKGEHFRTGAEARIFRGKFLGYDVVIKERYPRTYRVKELDDALRKKRVRSEARLLVEARDYGVNTPRILDLDPVDCVLVIEYLSYPSLKDVLADNGESDREKLGQLIRETGWLIGILHTNNIIHGDLTTSNILVNENELWFIDFGLAEKNAELEEKGVDLHVFAEAFESTHSSLMILLEQFYHGYLLGNPLQGADVVKRAEEISKRGRYS